jgi:hypothetical protein
VGPDLAVATAVRGEAGQEAVADRLGAGRDAAAGVSHHRRSAGPGAALPALPGVPARAAEGIGLYSLLEVAIAVAAR